MLALQLNQSAATSESNSKLDKIMFKLDQSFERQSSFEKALVMRFGVIKEDDLLDRSNTALLQKIIEFTEAREVSLGNGRMNRHDEGQESKEKAVNDVLTPLEILLRQNEETYELKLHLKTKEVLGAIDSVGQQISLLATNIVEEHRSVNHVSDF